MGPAIVRALAPSGRTAKAEVRLLAVGSILHFARDADIVWGSGVNGKVPTSEIDASSLDIRAVRGPLTAGVLRSKGMIVPDVFGDPGLLLPDLLGVRRSENPTRQLLVIPNLHDWPTWRRNPAVISPRSPFEVVVRAVAESTHVVASSLHGLVMADALGVPASLLRPSKENLFKYEDYYEGTGRRLPRVSDSIEEAVRRPGAPLEWNPDALKAAFPRELWAA
ncbi:polysaccharide pyruvyl transferase family protein [Microbacterium sp. BG28]|uniref:polysaccharide pyruvyl transferase family protein n=1 Tax=Microbacterium sp. BG28 TaxID=3097356 RepID=UPI002A5ABB15|nr:polysaccharide pyruvyl transferase family protein [Microbacterium sp. BG28]MDY0830148.1 polysaccharide pyruvyl transferase family protein [Microbacterium sp. BG28]